ncbi:AER143Wp [Eremothecium gossypii ATCC 10895]|uniref:Phosphotransferase n=1 Tax=Eremothecium gossypii (strain ATCC 10895 / CBS 109.51 / FGSC 9923 / NRRL Y-1056) TaxID=284811 RepID=Q756V8_EREGS|nr:AER143Wp [Eremothecium gossypii ATCC 10895]AAS52826.1 AER143Wp [Eremothecium gossypii ATCC 10895]AEY97132.1 FAER143Wp [Eremothecium gossypii FDAG1]
MRLSKLERATEARNALIAGYEDLSVNQVSRKVAQELQLRLETSTVSMLSSAVIPEDLCEARSASTVAEDFLLAIDIGGTTLKSAIISTVDFQVTAQWAYDIPHRIVDIAFFNRIVQWVCERVFMHVGRSRYRFLLGITFSFPLNTKNEITTMGKGFQMTEEVRNVSLRQILEQSFAHIMAHNTKYRFQVSLGGIVNDTVAVFWTNKMLHGGDNIAMILGTGINFCFALPFAAVPRAKMPIACSEDVRLLINSEAGFLGANFLPLSQFDQHQGEQAAPFMPLEYLTAGKWIPLSLRNALAYCDISSVRDIEFTGELLGAILDGRASDFFRADEFPAVQDLARTLVDRAAFCLHATIYGIHRFRHGDDPTGAITISFAGSFLRFCTYYYEKLKEVSDGKIKYTFLPDSNLLGASLFAAYQAAKSGRA